MTLENPGSRPVEEIVEESPDERPEAVVEETLPDEETAADESADAEAGGDPESDESAPDEAAVEPAVVVVNGDDETPAAEPGGEDDPEAAARALEGRIEATLFSSEVPLNVKRLGELARTARREVLAAIDRLNVFYGESGRAFRISSLAGGFQLVTTPEYAELLTRLHKDRVPTRLSRAALETLSIIAFKQPVTRAEVDAIRGVSASDRVLRHLIERKLVKISGRAEAPGRPLLYATTREFLAYFGLSAVTDLPRPPELAALLAGDAPKPVHLLEDEVDEESHSEEESDGPDGSPSP